MSKDSPNLPSIEGTNNNKQKQKDHNQSYYKALHQLKEVNDKIGIYQNRIKLLSQKEEQAQHPVSDYFQRKEQRLKYINKQFKEKSHEELHRLKQKSISEIALRKTRNQISKQQHIRRADRSKRIMTQYKYHKHDVIKHHTELNRSTIERLKQKSLMEKQQKSRSILEQSRRSKVNLKQMQQSRIEAIKKESHLQTKRLLSKIKQKQKQLQFVQQQYQQHEHKLSEVLSKRERKLKKLYHSNKPFTVQTNSALLQNSTSTPRSNMNYVFIA